MSETTIGESEGRAKPNPRIVKHVARIISGLERAQWKELDTDGKRPHIVMAKRVLNGIDRYSTKHDI